MTSSLHHTSLASMPAAGRADWVDGWGLRCALPLDAATGCWCQHPAAAVGRECRWYDDLRTVRTASRRGDWVLVPAPRAVCLCCSRVGVGGVLVMCVRLCRLIKL